MTQELRAAVYLHLAEALDDPPDWLALPGREWPLYQAAWAVAAVVDADSTAACAATDLTLALELIQAVEAETLEGRRERYERLFAEPGRSIAIYESGALHGRLLTAETFAVERWYKQAGLTVEGAEMPDHACLELAFLAMVCGNPSAGSEAQFLEQHAGRWLPGFGRMLAASADPVYAPIGRLLSAWLESAGPGTAGRAAPSAAYPARASARPYSAPPSPARLYSARPYSARLPAIENPRACTLCSFCASECPARALSMFEDGTSTALVLQMERCTGCGKCLRVCPERALSLQPGSGVGRMTLRQSPRVLCKGCGLPMVSQAELAYLSACLEDPAWLAYCPGCRGKNL